MPSVRSPDQGSVFSWGQVTRLAFLTWVCGALGAFFFRSGLAELAATTLGILP